MDNSKHVGYVNSHVDEIAEYVNECFEQSKEFIKAKLIRQIRDELSPIPVHYELKYVYDPYDHSGILVEDGYVSLDQTIGKFLENEYSGNREATYESGRGWNYPTYGEDIDRTQYTDEMAWNIMLSAIHRHIENHFGESLSDDELTDIRNSCDNFDEIYENCKAFDFFNGMGAVEFAGIENMLLKDIVRKGRISYGTT